MSTVGVVPVRTSRALPFRRGFTLVELLVVIGILAVLMALLFPAVNSAVEGSRRISCATKTTRLAMAMTSYDSRQGFFPGIRNELAIKSPGGSSLPVSPGQFPMPNSTTNWFVMLLPHLERTPVFNDVVDGQIWLVETGRSLPTPSKQKHLTNSLTVCPSRGDFYAIAYADWQTLHYRANASPPSTFNRNDGALGDNASGASISLADVAAGDGTSTTLLIAEGRKECWYPNTCSGTYAMDGKTAYGVFPLDARFSPDGFYVHPALGGEALFGFPTSLANPTATTRVINITGGDSRYPSSAEGMFANQSSASHRGGANVAFVDGSCKFLKEELLPHVYGHLLTHRSDWRQITTTTGTYSTNSAVANQFLQCSPATKPYTLDPKDY